MAAHRASRNLALALALLAAATNVSVATQLISYGRSLNWETQSEWDDIYGWEVDGLMIIWGLLSVYFTIASCVCAVGVVGVLKRVPTYVRLFRDYSLVDLSFCTFLIAMGAFASFHPSTRIAVCQLLSSHPELLRDLSAAGLDLENCESWFESAVVLSVAATALIFIIRLQFILTVTSYYRQLIHHNHPRPLEMLEALPGRYHDHESPSSDQRRIFLLPAGATEQAGFMPTSVKAHASTSSGAHPRRSASLPGPHAHAHATAPIQNNEIMIYAPLPYNSLSPQEARNLEATEAWVTHSPQDPVAVDLLSSYSDDTKEL